MTNNATISPVLVAKIRNGKVKPGVNVQSRTWTSKTGYVFKLRPISWSAAQRLQTNPVGKPVVPKIQVTYGAGQSGWEANPDDPAYIDALKSWRAQNEYTTMTYCLGLGVDIEVPDEFLLEQRPFFPDATMPEFRYHYIASIIDANELADFVTAIMSQTIPTEQGIAEAEAAFPSNGQ